MGGGELGGEERGAYLFVCRVCSRGLCFGRGGGVRLRRGGADGAGWRVFGGEAIGDGGFELGYFERFGWGFGRRVPMRRALVRASCCVLCGVEILM
jgi:hypothetical protein